MGKKTIAATKKSQEVRIAKKIAKQEQFLEALKQSNGMILAALRMCEFNINMYREWRTDAEFVKKVNTVRDIRKEFVEEALMKKVEEGDTACIIFCAKTLLKDRGYTDKIEMDVNAKVDSTLKIEIVSKADEVDTNEIAMQ